MAVVHLLFAMTNAQVNAARGVKCAAEWPLWWTSELPVGSTRRVDALE